MVVRNLRAAATVAAAVACAAGAAACGSSDEGSAAGGGDAIKVMTIGPVEAPQFSVPSIEVGARAAVDAINADGGIDGRRLELIVCNDENDPNAAVGCARRAVAERVAAIVGGYTMFEPQVVPVVERAGIPWVGPTALQNSTSESYHLLGGEAATLTFAIGQRLAEQGCREVVTIGENAPASKAAVELVGAGVEAAGGRNGRPVYGATNAADWGPVVAAALADGADCLAFMGSVGNTPKVVTAVAQSGRDVTVATAQSLLPAQAVEALGDAADGVVMTSGYLPFTSSEPGVRALVRAARAIDPDVPLDAQLQSSYAAVKVFAEAARGLDTVDAETVGAALDRLSGFDTGLGPVVDFTRPNPTRSFARVTNPEVFVLEARGGEVVLADPEPLDTTPVFEALADAGR